MRQARLLAGILLVAMMSGCLSQFTLEVPPGHPSLADAETSGELNIPSPRALEASSQPSTGAMHMKGMNHDNFPMKRAGAIRDTDHDANGGKQGMKGAR